jgi:hypothetical protein
VRVFQPCGISSQPAPKQKHKVSLA